MSTTDYLKTLSYDQLCFCRDKADEMIRAIQEEERLVVWFVTDGSINYGWFRTSDYPKAIACFTELAEKHWREADQENPSPKGDDLNLFIKGLRLTRTEYKELFGEDA